MNDEVIEHLTKRENLAAALELEAVVREARIKVLDRFWRNVRLELQNRLTGALQDRWEVMAHLSVADKNSRLGFVGKAGPKDNQYAFLFGDLGGCERGGRAYVGVTRPTLLHTQERAAAEEGVREGLRRRSVMAQEDPVWVAYAFLNDLGLPITAIHDNDAVVQANTDNHNEARPLAKHTADFLWSLFQDNRHAVETLNATA